MTRKKVLMLLGSVCLALMLVVPIALGCAGPAPSPTPTPTPTPAKPTPTPAPPAKPFEAKWKLHTPYPLTEGDHLRAGLVEFADLIGERTGGQLDIEVSLGGALGYKGGDAFRVMSENLVEIQEVTSAYIESTEPLVSVVSLPFLMKNFDETLWWQNIFQPYMEKIYAKYNGKLLYSGLWPPQHFFTKKPIRTVGDFKGMKARSLSPIYAETAKALGMVPVTVPWAEVGTALERGMIDTMTTSALSTSQAAGWDYVDWTIKTGYCQFLADVVVNKDAWNELPDDIKLIVIETAREMQRKTTNGAKIADFECIAILESHGMQTMTLDPEVRAQMVEKVKPVWDKILQDAGPEGKEMLNKFLYLVGRA